MKHSLTFAGALPFIMCAFCLIIGIETLPILGETRRILSVYALVIAAFMAGVHWGEHLHIVNKPARALMVSSNIIAVALWLGFLTLNFTALMILCAAAFYLLLAIDYQLFRQGIIAHDYFKTRVIVTIIVITSILGALIGSLAAIFN
jgi:hypothetical protein